MPLPYLPQSQNPWSASVRQAYQKLSQIYETAESYINSGGLETHRLDHYRRSIIEDAYPIVTLLGETAESESIPQELEWVEGIANMFTTLLNLLWEQWLLAKNEEYVNLLSS
jgi:hypothetical protein